MKTTTYFTLFFLSLMALFVMMLHLDKLPPTWQWLQGAYILLFIGASLIIFLSFRSNSRTHLLGLIFVYGFTMINILVLFFLTGLISLMIIGEIVCLLGLVITMESISAPRYLPDLPPLPSKQARNAGKAGKRNNSKDKKKQPKKKQMKKSARTVKKTARNKTSKNRTKGKSKANRKAKKR